jgi:hypothetical protein
VDSPTTRSDIELREQVIALVFPELSSSSSSVFVHSQQDKKTNDFGVEEVVQVPQPGSLTFNEHIDNEHVNAIQAPDSTICDHREDTDLSASDQEETVLTAFSEWLHGDTNEEEEDDSKSNTANYCGIVIAFLFTLFLMTSIIASLLSIQGYNFKKGKSHHMLSNTTSTRATQLLDRLVAELHVVSPKKNTPQFQALRFLIYNDKFYNLLNDDDDEEEDHIDDPDDPDWQDIIPNLEQRYALLVLYYGLGGEFAGRNGWASLSGALLHECSWPGILCEEDFVVTELVLDPHVVARPSAIQGRLHTEIGRLRNLRRLMISDAISLVGEIPWSLYALSNLYALQLSNLTLTSTIATEIANLSNLIYLNLENAGIVGTIPSALSNLIQLQVFDVSENPFLTGTVPTEFGASWSSLERADFRGTGLTGTIPHTMCSIPRLKLLSIDDCPPVVENMTVPSSSSKNPKEFTAARTDPFLSCRCCTPPSCRDDPGR